MINLLCIALLLTLLIILRQLLLNIEDLSNTYFVMIGGISVLLYILGLVQGSQYEQDT